MAVAAEEGEGEGEELERKTTAGADWMEAVALDYLLEQLEKVAV